MNSRWNSLELEDGVRLSRQFEEAGWVSVEARQAVILWMLCSASSAVRRTKTSGGTVRSVNQLAASMRANGWQGAPIDVVELNGQRIVVDGHHRLAAARRAGIDVQYQVVDPSTAIGPGKYASIDDILRSTYSVGRDRLR